MRQVKSQSSASWCAIEKSLSRGNNIEEGHFCERIWGGLLNKPLSTEATEQLYNRKKFILCKARWKNRCGALAYEE